MKLFSVRWATDDRHPDAVKVVNLHAAAYAQCSSYIFIETERWPILRFARLSFEQAGPVAPYNASAKETARGRPVRPRRIV